jgi:hypothetical protein
MKRHEDIRKMPIYQKAELIFKLVESLYATLPNDDVLIEATKEFMRGDAMILSAKIAGAEGGDLYAIRMQNAALIREHAMHLYVQVGSLRFHENYADLEYVELIRKEIENFRELFIEWIQSFDTSNYIWDDWELFNPPGAIKPSSDD